MSPPKRPWEHFRHEADIGVRGRGASREEAFANAALALTGVVTRPEAVTPASPVDIECAATEDDLLLYDWLNSVVYEMATRHMLFGRFEVRIEDSRLQARAWGEAVDRPRHRPAVEVKGATFTALHVRRTRAGRWIAQAVLDV